MSRPTFNLGAFLEKEKLKTDGSNFTTWFHTLRIILTPHKMGYVLDAAVGAAPNGNASNDESDLQKSLEKMSAFEIITDLKAIFAPQVRAERYEASKLFFSSRMDENSSVSEHIVKMFSYVQCLNALECQILDELAMIGCCSHCP
jgi:hypothetical protein